MSEKLIKCAVCGKEIAKSAKTCPSCGAKQKKPIYKRWWFWVLLIILIPVIISALSRDDKESSDNDKANTDTQVEETIEGGKSNPYPKDATAIVGDIEWKIISAENLGSTISSGNRYIENCKADSGSFIKLVVSVKNNRSDMFTITDLAIYDDQDRRFITSSDVFMCVKDELFILDNINPGIQKTYTAVYEIPEDAKNLKLELDSTGSLFNGASNKYISLGL